MLDTLVQKAVKLNATLVNATQINREVIDATDEIKGIVQRAVDAEGNLARVIVDNTRLVREIHELKEQLRWERLRSTSYRKSLDAATEKLDLIKRTI